MNLYNEIAPRSAEWLRNLIAQKELASIRRRMRDAKKQLQTEGK